MNQPPEVKVYCEPAVTDIFAGLIADPSEKPVKPLCAICDQPFTPQQWHNRHADDDGHPIHEGCRIREAARCAACDQGFTPQEWDDRHSDDNGEDVHEACCQACFPESARRFDLTEVRITQLRAEVAALTNQLSGKEQPHDPDQHNNPDPRGQGTSR